MRNQLKTLVLLGALSAVLIGFGALVAPQHLYLFGALALATNLGAYFFSDRIVLRLHRAHEVRADQAPALHAMVAELAAEARIPRPRVFVIPEQQPNAFATGRNPKHSVIAVTDGLLQLLDHRELRAVIAHELAHIKNRDVLVATIAAAAAALITYVAQMLTFSSLFGGSSASDDESEGAGAGASGLLVALVAPLAATLIQLGISRSREHLADETGARLSGDPESLARALVKLERVSEHVAPAHAAPATASLFIVNPFGPMQTAARWFSTHPTTLERVRRLEAIARRLPRTPMRRSGALFGTGW